MWASQACIDPHFCTFSDLHGKTWFKAELKFAEEIGSLRFLPLSQTHGVFTKAGIWLNWNDSSTRKHRWFWGASRKTTMNMLKSCYSHWNSPREVLKCCWETNPKTDSHLPAAFASVGSKWWDLHHDFDSRCPTSRKSSVNHGKSINSFHCWF